MKKYKVILFDVDGTLVESSVGVTLGVAHTLRRYGIEPPPCEELKKFIGPPLRESFRNFYGFEGEALSQVEYVFREYYDKKGINEMTLYPGIKSLLHDLKNAGAVVATASSKPYRHVKRVLENFGIAQYFDYVGAADHERGIVEKEDVLQELLSNTGYAPSECLLVGDRLYDIVGAHKFGIDCAGVLYGFGSRSELEEYGADYIISSVEELREFLFAL